jgi:hypothetical protein
MSYGASQPTGGSEVDSDEREQALAQRPDDIGRKMNWAHPQLDRKIGRTDTSDAPASHTESDAAQDHISPRSAPHYERELSRNDHAGLEGLVVIHMTQYLEMTYPHQEEKTTQYAAAS